MNLFDNPRASAALRHIITKNSKPGNGVCKPMKPLPLVNPKSLPLVQPYVSQWSIRAVANIKKNPTEEEKALEKMIFQCLWDMRVVTQQRSETV